MTGKLHPSDLTVGEQMNTIADPSQMMVNNLILNNQPRDSRNIKFNTTANGGGAIGIHGPPQNSDLTRFRTARHNSRLGNSSANNSIGFTSAVAP